MRSASKKRAFQVESLEQRNAPSGAVHTVTDLGGQVVTTPGGTAHVNNAVGGVDAHPNPDNEKLITGCYDGTFVNFTPSDNFNVSDHCPPGQDTSM